MHHLWITELLRWVKPRLPMGYRAYIGTAPMLAIGAPAGRPDVSIHRLAENPQDAGDRSQEGSAEAPDAVCEPDLELAVATLEPGTALMVERQGRLVAAIELVSPRNKDRPTSRDAYLSRYLGYLMESVNLLLVDVHRRPLGFSFPDRIAAALAMACEPLPTPSAISYEVAGPAATGGRYLAIWRRSLAPGMSLPPIPLALDGETRIAIDLEATYTSAAADVYLD
jgi:hypothetical protein